MNFLFAFRYFKSKKSTNAINIIAWISVVAIAVGTTALIVVLSVFNGFEDLVKGLYKDFYSDVRVIPAQGKVLHFTPQQTAEIKKIKGVDGVSFLAEEKASLVNGEYQTIVFVKGIDSSYEKVNGVSKHIIRGKYDMGTADNPALVVGAGIENAVAMISDDSQDKLVLYMPDKKATSFKNIDEALTSSELRPAGTFMVQQEFDNKYVFTNLAFLKFMLNLGPDEYSAVEIKASTNNLDETVKLLQGKLGKDYKVQTRYQQNQSLYTVMMIEKWVIYGILCLILVVAAFNMIGALTMLVLEKQKDIAVLKAMGATNGVIQKIFLTEGFLLAALGGLIGTALATIVCWLQLKFHLIKLSGGSFIIDYYPVKMQPFDYVLVIATVSIVALFAAWIPSRKASLQEFSLKT